MVLDTSRSAREYKKFTEAGSQTAVAHAEQRVDKFVDNDAEVAKVEQRALNKTYIASAGADNVIKASAGFLYGFQIGKDVSTSVIEISDHASDGDGNVKIYLEGDTLMTSNSGYVPVNASFDVGITVDLANQTNVTFYWR